MQLNDILRHRKFQTFAARFLSKVGSTSDKDECWLWSGAMHKGYGSVQFHTYRKHHKWSAHRVAWLIANGAIPAEVDGKKAYVLHSCDNPPCCNPNHLFLGNHRANTDDMVAKRRHVFGSRSHFARLTEADVEAILDSPDSCRSLAKRFGVGYYTVADIRHRLSWAHVRPGEPANPAYLQRTRPKLTAADAIAIFNDPRPRSKIAADYGVAPSHVRDIHYGKHWAKTTGWTKTVKRR